MLKLKSSNLILLLSFILLSCGANGQKPNEAVENIKISRKLPVGKLSRIEKDGRFGYKDEKDNIIVNVVYNQLPDHPWELMNVNSGRECGLINYLGDTLIEFGKYRMLKMEHSLPFINDFDENGVLFFSDSAVWSWVCQKGNLFGMIDQFEKELIPIEHEKYKYIFNNKYAFYKNGSWTVYNSRGQRLTSMEFDDVNQIFKNKYFIYKKDNLYGVYDVLKNRDALGLHDLIIGLEADILAVKDNNHYSLYNLLGSPLLDLQFDTLFVNWEINSPVDKSILLDYANHEIIAWSKAKERIYFINKEGDVIEIK